MVVKPAHLKRVETGLKPILGLTPCRRTENPNKNEKKNLFNSSICNPGFLHNLPGMSG